MLKRYMSIVLLFSSTFISSTSCSTNKPLFGCYRSTITPSISIDTLSATTQKVEIEGKKFKLYGSLGSSFEAGTCIDINIKMLAEDTSSRLPESYNYEYLWVINKNEVWETNSFERKKIVNENYDVISGGGPSWGIGNEKGIYAVAKINDGKGKTYLVRSEELIMGFTVPMTF